MPGIALIALLCASAAAAQRIEVSPAHGGPKTTFRVSFRAPDSAGVQTGLWTQYLVEASRQTPPRGCTASTSLDVGRASAGSHVRVTLRPSARAGWCKGTFRGRIDETQTPRCMAHLACPLFIRIVKHLGTFTFRVG